MNLKTECKQLIELLTAIENGGTLQRRASLTREGPWRDYGSEDIQFGLPMECYRIKPAPKLRAWKADEVPVGAIVRVKSIFDGVAVHVAVLAWRTHSECGSALAGSALPESMPNFCADFGHALKHWEHSLDHGKTWLPCGISE